MFRIPEKLIHFFLALLLTDFVVLTQILKCMHLVNMHTTINENASIEEHKTDGGFDKQMPPVQRTLCTTFILLSVDLDLKLCCIVISAVF